VFDVYTVGGQEKPRFDLRDWQSVDINDVVVHKKSQPVPGLLMGV